MNEPDNFLTDAQLALFIASHAAAHGAATEVMVEIIAHARGFTGSHVRRTGF